jgi:hypothetical protein
MLANEPCGEDLIPKNRQNNVYGHGHVEAVAAVMEAAQRDYQLDSTIALTVDTSVGIDDRIHLSPGDSIKVELSGYLDTVQWRSNHLRDDWSNLHSFDEGDSVAYLDLKTIVHQLEHLPGIDVEGNHTLSLRGLAANDSGGHSSSTLISVNVMLMDTANAKNAGGSDGVLATLSAWAVPAAGLFVLMLIVLGSLIISKAEEATMVESVKWYDDDIEAVADGASLD